MGALMSKNPETICSKCYAKKGMYRFSNVKSALQRRLESLHDPLWAPAMIFLIKDMPYFRWHDSGDIQSVDHLLLIAMVAERTPNTIHWLPTREYGMVAEYLRKYGEFPENLVVRLSATKFNGVAPVALCKKLGVYASGASATDYNCPAYKQKNVCGDCRKKKKKKVFQVNYKKH